MFFSQSSRYYCWAISWFSALGLVWPGFVYAQESEAVMTTGMPWWLLIVVSACLILSHWGIIAWLLKKNKRKTADLQSNMEDQLSQSRADVQREVRKHDLTEGQLKKTKDYLHGLINSLPTVVIGVSDSGKVTHWNNGRQLREYLMEPCITQHIFR